MKHLRVSDLANGTFAMLVVAIGFLLFAGTSNYYAAGMTFVALLLGIIVFDTLMSVYGFPRAILSCTVLFVLCAGFVAAGILTGWPFGSFEFTGLLGYELFDVVPWTVPILWLLLVTTAFAHTQPVFIKEKNVYETLFSWAFDAAIVTTVLDIVIEPVASSIGLKIFQPAQGFQGIPFQHYLGWFMITFFLEALLLAMMKWSPMPPRSMRALTIATSLFVFLCMLFALKGSLMISFGLGLVMILWLFWKQGNYARKSIVVSV